MGRLWRAALAQREQERNPSRAATPTWKSNVRKRHQARYELGNRCDKCGLTFGGDAPGKQLGRHHEWEGHVPGDPPPVEGVYCKRCHAEVEGRLLTLECPDCRETITGWNKHKRRCKARKERLARQHEEYLAAIDAKWSHVLPDPGVAT